MASPANPGCPPTPCVPIEGKLRCVSVRAIGYLTRKIKAWGCRLLTLGAIIALVGQHRHHCQGASGCRGLSGGWGPRGPGPRALWVQACWANGRLLPTSWSLNVHLSHPALATSHQTISHLQHWNHCWYKSTMTESNLK